MSFPLMECGHVAQGRHGDDPVCVICIGIDERATKVSGPVDLDGRVAACAYCGRTEPSRVELAFFEYRGPGSRKAIETCAHCGCTPGAHERKQADPASVGRHVCDGFEAHGPWATDSFYDGCRGFD